MSEFVVLEGEAGPILFRKDEISMVYATEKEGKIYTFIKLSDGRGYYIDKDVNEVIRKILGPLESITR